VFRQTLIIQTSWLMFNVFVFYPDDPGNTCYDVF
jgi:hypothetical protein